MIEITVNRKNGKIVRVLSHGHADYAESGSDIVCAAVSSVLQTALLGLLKVAGVDVEFDRDDDNGRLDVRLVGNLSEKERHDADVVLETMLLGVADLSEGFSDYIKLEVR